MPFYDELVSLIRPELLILMPVLCFLGYLIKNKTTIASNNIPFILLGCSVFLTAVWMLGQTPITGFAQAMTLLFSILVQGSLVSAASVFAHQLYKQAKEKPNNTP